MAKMTQKQRILEFVRLHGSITQRDALALGIYRLGARIWELRSDGYPFKAVMERVQNRDGSFSWVARYYLPEEAETA